MLAGSGGYARRRWPTWLTVLARRAEAPYNPAVRCHAGKTAGFVPAERHLTFPSDSATDAECGPNGKRTFNPGVEGSNPTRLSSVV